MGELLHAIGLGLIVFLPLMNPLTTVTLFLALSGNMTEAERNRQIFWTCIYVFIIMVVAYYCGQLVMSTFGISIPGLRIAGGMIVSYIGFRLLFPQPKPAVVSAEAKDKKSEIVTPANIAFVPLAMPSTAGPGTIAMIISIASTVQAGGVNVPDWIIYTSSILIPLILSIILWICLRSSGAILRLIGKSGIDAVSQMMGFLLVCMGVQFVINGVKEIIQTFPNI